MKRRLLSAITMLLLCIVGLTAKAEFKPTFTVSPVNSGVNINIVLPESNVTYPVQATFNVMDSNQNGWAYKNVEITSAQAYVEIRGLVNGMEFFTDVQVVDAGGQTYGETLQFVAGAPAAVPLVDVTKFSFLSGNKSITLTSPEGFVGMLTVTNLLGQQVTSIKVAEGTTHLDVNIQKGLYVVSVTDDLNKAVLTKKVWVNE